MATHFYPRSPSAPTGIVFVPWVRPSVRLSIPNDITSLVISAISLRFGDTMRYMYQGADRCLKWPCSAHDDVIKWKHFPRYWPFGRGIHRSPVNSHHKGQAVTRSFDIFYDLRLNKRLSKQSRRRWFEKPSRSLWRHCNVARFMELWKFL